MSINLKILHEYEKQLLRFPGIESQEYSKVYFLEVDPASKDLVGAWVPHDKTVILLKHFSKKSELSEIYSLMNFQKSAEF